MRLTRHDYSCGRHEYELTADGYSCRLTPVELFNQKLFRAAVRYEFPRCVLVKLVAKHPRDWMAELAPSMLVVTHAEPLRIPPGRKPLKRRRLVPFTKAA